MIQQKLFKLWIKMIQFLNLENPTWRVTKRKHGVFIIAVFCLLLQNCSSQTSKNIGDGVFDLDSIDFTIPLDTLAAKIPYNISGPLEDGHYDKELQKTVITDTFAYQRKIKGLNSYKDESNGRIFYFLNKSFKVDRVDFFLDRDKNFVAFSFFESSETPYDYILTSLKTKYGKYDVVTGEENKVYAYYGGEEYKWETDNRVIKLVRTIKKSGGTYTCNISVVKSDVDLTKFPVDKILSL